MSTLEKAMDLLKILPESKLESVYMYMCFVDSLSSNSEKETGSSMEKRQRGFQGLMSFAGTLPDDFDYKKELEEARNEKYSRFI